jgi:alkylhydroperoxidase family enzyme
MSWEVRLSLASFLARRPAGLVEQSGVPPQTLRLVYLRASQINGCSVCVDMDLRFAKQLLV